MLLSRGLRGESIPMQFSFLERAPLAHGLFVCLKNQQCALLELFFCSHISDSTLLSPSSTFKDPCVDSESEGCTVVSDSLQPHGLYSPLNSPGQNTGVGSCSVLQGIFPILGSNTDFSHCRLILYQLSHHGNPRILKRVAFPFSRGSSQPRN